MKNNSIIIDDDGNTIKKDIFYKKTHSELKRLSKEVSGITDVTFEWQSKLKNLDENIELINTNLEEIKKSIPIKFTKRLTDASRISNDLMGLGKLIFIIILAIVLWTSAVSFKDIIIDTVIPNSSKVEKLQEQVDSLIKSQKNPLFPTKQKDIN